MRRLVLVAVVLGWAVQLPAAGGAENRVVAFPAFKYTPERVEMAKGDTLAFVNADGASGEGHSLTHAVAAGGERFASPIVPIGSNAPVGGVEALEPGEYAFTCRVHPFMKGTLVVR